MAELPRTLENLLRGEPPSDEAWAAFAREYTALLLHVARSVARGTDEAMDAYAYLLEHLSADGCRRLRAYSSDPRSKFTTWLVVVARRICIDHHRAKYGRLRNQESSTERDRLVLRRRLENLDDAPAFADSIPDDSATSPVTAVENAELTNELKALRASLAPADRLLLNLRFDDGLSAAEIAVLLRYSSQFHVYRRINSLLAEMKARLNARGFESAVS
ncbi:MAG: sigma-70 family RNA polymerase sigma factor [Gemmatimonadales bacterium]